MPASAVKGWTRKRQRMERENTVQVRRGGRQSVPCGWALGIFPVVSCTCRRRSIHSRLPVPLARTPHPPIPRQIGSQSQLADVEPQGVLISGEHSRQTVGARRVELLVEQQIDQVAQVIGLRPKARHRRPSSAVGSRSPSGPTRASPGGCPGPPPARGGPSAGIAIVAWAWREIALWAHSRRARWMRTGAL